MVTYHGSNSTQTHAYDEHTASITHLVGFVINTGDVQTYIHTSFPTVCFLENAVKLLLEPELFRGDRAHGPETRAWTRGLDRESGSLPLQHCSNLPSRVTTKDLRLEINKPIFLCYRWPTAHRTHRKQILSSSEIVLEHCLRC